MYEEKYKVIDKANPKPNQNVSNMLRIIKYTKSAEIKYEKETILDNVKINGDLYTLSNILRTIEIVYYFLNLLSQTTTSQKELLITGCYLLGMAGWRMKLESKCIEFLKEYFQIDYLNAFGMLTFRHLAAFAIQIQTEEPLNTFGKVMKSLLSEYTLRLLLQSVEIVAHKIKEKELTIVLEYIIQTMEKLEKNFDHPEWLWNESTRKEFHQAIKSQYEAYYTKEINESNFIDELKDIEYTAYKEEIKVENIFIRLINKDPYMKLNDPTQVMKNIIQSLSKPSLLNTETLKLTKKLIQALYNVIMYQKGIDYNMINKGDIKVLCDFIDPILEEVPEDRMSLCYLVLNVLVELAKHHKQTVNIVQCRAFVKLAFYQLTHRTNFYIQKAVMGCLENIMAQPECDKEIASNGLLLIFLSNGINREIDKPLRTMQFQYAQEILARNPELIQELSTIIPKILIDQFAESDYKKATEWIDYLDEDRQEIYYTWNKELYNCVMKGFETEITKMKEQVMNKQAEGQIMWEVPKKSYISEHFNKGEIIVRDVVISIFIKNPYVHIRVSIYLNVEIVYRVLKFIV